MYLPHQHYDPDRVCESCNNLVDAEGDTVGDECPWGPNICDNCGGCICDLSC